MIQLAFICDCKIRGSVFNLTCHRLICVVLRSACAQWQTIALCAKYLSAVELNPPSPVWFVFLSSAHKKVENPSNFSLDKATSLLKCLWPYIMVVLGVKIELTNNLERVMLISIHLAMTCVPGGIGHMDDRKIHGESYYSILIICFLKPLVKNINTIFNTWELN